MTSNSTETYSKGQYDIKPRVDDDGVPWCDDGCPHCKDVSTIPGAGWCLRCDIDNETQEGDVCPHAVRRMALENEAWRRHDLKHWSAGYILWIDGTGWIGYPTIDAAIDALMAGEKE